MAIGKQKIPSLAETMRDELINFKEVWTKEAAKVARDELTKTAKDAILAFYHDYTPSDYQRHYYNFLKNSFKPLYKNNHKVTYSGGIWITFDELDQIYKGDAQMIGEQVYAGKHGNWETLNTELSTPTMSPSPMEIILKKYYELVDDFYNNGSCWWKAFSVASSQPYTMISFK